MLESKSEMINGNNLTRLLLKSLRHDPGLLGITLDADGWSNVVDVANCVELQFGEVAIEELKASIALLVQSERIEICGSKIRASYGASIKRKSQQTDIPTCRLFHGTRVSIYRKLERLGLRSKNREYVHLTSSIDYAQAIARKWPDGLVLEIDVKNALIGGVGFSRATSHVWLACHVPAEYLMAY